MFKYKFDLYTSYKIKIIFTIKNIYKLKILL